MDDDDRAAIRDTLRFFEVEPPDLQLQHAEAIADGHLVPYEIYRAMTARTAATDGFSVPRAPTSIGPPSTSRPAPSSKRCSPSATR